MVENRQHSTLHCFLRSSHTRDIGNFTSRHCTLRWDTFVQYQPHDSRWRHLTKSTRTMSIILNDFLTGPHPFTCHLTSQNVTHIRHPDLISTSSISLISRTDAWPAKHLLQFDVRLLSPAPSKPFTDSHQRHLQSALTPPPSTRLEERVASPSRCPAGVQESSLDILQGRELRQRAESRHRRLGAQHRGRHRTHVVRRDATWNTKNPSVFPNQRAAVHFRT